MTIREKRALSETRIEEYLQSLDHARRSSEAHDEIGGCMLRLQPPMTIISKCFIRKRR